MPVVLWKSGALAPRRARRINNGLQPRWGRLSRRWSFSETSLARPQKFGKIATFRLLQKTDSDLVLKRRGFSRAAGAFQSRVFPQPAKPHAGSLLLAEPNLRSRPVEICHHVRNENNHEFVGVFFLGVIHHRLIKNLPEPEPRDPAHRPGICPRYFSGHNGRFTILQVDAPFVFPARHACDSVLPFP